MKRVTRIFLLSLCLVLLALAAAPAALAGEAPAEAFPGRVFDNGSLYTPREESMLQSSIQQLVGELNIDLGVATDKNTSRTTIEDADYFFDGNEMGLSPSRDGILFLINMGHREIHILTSGLALDLLNDADIESLLDDISPHMGKGNYFDAAQQFLASVKAMLEDKLARDAAATQQVPVPAFGEADPSVKVQDYAGLFNQEERANLEARVHSAIKKTGVDFAVVTISGTAGMSMQNYADDFYDYNGFGTGENADGVLLLIRARSTRPGWNIHVTTSGSVIPLFSDETLNELLDGMATSMNRNRYWDAAATFVSQSSRHIDDILHPKFVTIGLLVGAVLGGAALAGIVVAVLATRQEKLLETSRAKASDLPVAEYNLTHESDALLSSDTKKTPRPIRVTVSVSSGSSSSSGSGFFSSSSSGSSYSSHSSSSGSSHGGGGRSSDTSSRSSSGGSRGGGSRGF